MPTDPGVYWFLDSNDKIIYVGKAVNLKNRILSYTHTPATAQKTLKLVHTAVALKFKSLESEFDAIITEANLIKAHQPIYNILLKDDKSPLYIIISSHQFPKILTARKKQLYTLYSNIPDKNVFGPFTSAYQVKKIIKALRKIFKFCNTPGIKPPKACFYTHINQCSGACEGKFTSKEYKLLISRIRQLLLGKRRSLITKLKQEMSHYSHTSSFEQAAQIRDMIIALDSLSSISDKYTTASIMPSLVEDQDSALLTETSLLLHNLGIVPAGYQLNRIEAYDISNLADKFSTASMVVFVNGKPDVSEYRNFKIKYTNRGGDPAKIAEALERRLNHPEWIYPDLIVIDGGKTQLNAAHTVINGQIPTISLVKNPDRLLVRHHHKFNYYTLNLHTGSAKLFTQLRDESHRFAKKYQSQLASRALTQF